MRKVKYPIFKCMHRGEKGFTLIELLVVIAILGVIAAVVALNVAGFFGRGTLQAANTELHQAQTAIVACMADAESNNITVNYANADNTWWAGEEGVIVAHAAGGGTFDAATYCYGPFRAEYDVSTDPTTIGAIVDGNPDIPGGWGTGIIWDNSYSNWAANSE